MAYNTATDFLALLRTGNAGAQLEQMPGLDFVVTALARAGMFSVFVGQSAPTSNQTSTVWVKPATPSWSAECAVYLWNPTTQAYALATPDLWSQMPFAFVAPKVQDVVLPGPANILTNVDVVRVNQSVGAPITLVLPLAAAKLNPVLISDWRGDAGTNPITISTQGGDIFPGGRTSWFIAADTGSVFLRPVLGGYAL